jgi:hypothetical protein
MKTISPNQARDDSPPEPAPQAKPDRPAPAVDVLAAKIRARIAERAKRRQALIKPDEPVE